MGCWLTHPAQRTQYPTTPKNTKESATMAKRRKTRKTHKASAKHSGHKGQIPLSILEKRAKRLISIVKSRGGKIAA